MGCSPEAPAIRAIRPATSAACSATKASFSIVNDWSGTADASRAGQLRATSGWSNTARSEWLYARRVRVCGRVKRHAEALRRGDGPLAEYGLPDAVHHDAGQECRGARIGGREPLSEGGAAAAGALARGFANGSGFVGLAEDADDA